MSFPLGPPVNRKPPPGWVPSSRGPGWWRNQLTGEEKYIEPPRPVPTLFDLYGLLNPTN